MIEPYFGEFLINPVPLELSFNYCSHKCAYCFANLNKPDRQFDVLRFMRFIRDYPNRDTLAAIEAVRNGQRWIDLPPASSRVRRLQHELVRDANLISHSYGREPNRHVRIFRE